MITAEQRSDWAQARDVPARILQNRVDALLEELEGAEEKAAKLAQMLADGARGANEALSMAHAEIQRLRSRLERILAAGITEPGGEDQ